MTDKSDCPYQRKTAYQEPCYICGLGIRRELRADCPYHKLQRNLERCGREMKALYGERDELFELQSKAALIEHAVDKATESLSVEKAVNAALRKRIADLEAERDRLHGVHGAHGTHGTHRARYASMSPGRWDGWTVIRWR